MEEVVFMLRQNARVVVVMDMFVLTEIIKIKWQAKF